jgi:hypothetical protein
MSTDGDGTDEDLSEGVSHMPFPLAPARPESHGTRLKQVRLDQLKLASLANQHPRSGLSRPRIVETSDTFFFLLMYPKKFTYRFKKKCMVTCMF